MGKPVAAKGTIKSRPNKIAEVRERKELTQEQLSELTGLSVSYLSRMETGGRNVSIKNLTKVAKALEVSMGALITEEAPDQRAVQNIFSGAGTIIPLAGKIVAGGTIDVSSEQREPGVEYEVQLSINVPDGVVAYQVEGDSMMPAYRPNTVIICRAHTTEIDRHIGKELAVGTTEFGRMLKTVQPGTEPGRYNLESINATTMRNVQLAWVARIAAIIPADEWEIIVRNIQNENAKRERLKKPSQRQRKG